MAVRGVRISRSDRGGAGDLNLQHHTHLAMTRDRTPPFDRAPHHADVLLDCADSLLHNSRYEQARRTVEQALALNPAAPDEYLWVSATVQFFLHDYRTALATALRMTNPDPFGRFIAVCATLTGDRKLAARYRQRMQERQPDFRIADWRKLVPLKDEHDKRFFEDAMRKAGFH